MSSSFQPFQHKLDSLPSILSESTPRMQSSVKGRPRVPGPPKG
eukprot:CAMPEP_0118637372 /NCGR_PEP_ID=MMETSP0785-20121206/3117_1 /TAXON_ID=91992 /ORGANISM="Bolidomonas pacifica, Strain CCMP 1866" /LENGTH=42 /DNA_ID= /DNA_START= /DNA_END= /DNA_ORIENTATION=